jgi:hypothetical protein
LPGRERRLGFAEHLVLLDQLEGGDLPERLVLLGVMGSHAAVNAAREYPL